MKNRIKINKSVENILSNYSWIINDIKTRNKMKKSVSSILISEKKKFNIQDYRVIMDQSNNPSSVINSNSGVLETHIKQNEIWYVNTFTIMPNGGMSCKTQKRKDSINK